MFPFLERVLIIGEAEKTALYYKAQTLVPHTVGCPTQWAAPHSGLRMKGH